MFFDHSPLTGVASLEQNWRVIWEELATSGLSSFAPWKEKHIYSGAWETLFLYDGYQAKAPRRLPESCAHLPYTARLLADVPGLLTAGFSRLGPFARIVPHRGFDKHVVRVHLGLKVPLGCWLAVRWERRFWREREVLAFDDSYLHMAANPTPYERIVLVLDIDLGCRPSNILRRAPSSVTANDISRYCGMIAAFAARKTRLYGPPTQDAIPKTRA